MLYNKKAVIQLILVFAVLALPMLASAQFDITPDGGSGPDAPMGEAPIDGGLSLLVAAGVGYGARKLKKNHKL